MTKFSLIESVDKIYFERTKEYFQEVKSSYENGNYRSAVVSLYSIIICDIVYKLIDLRDIFGDIKAKGILNEIEELQKKNPKSPDWENKLIDITKERTDLISPSLFPSIKNIQNFRHLSAHPVLTQNYDLYKPNKESIIAFIRITLEELFTKPPLLSKSIFSKILEDIAKHSNSLLDNKEIKNFLESRYLKFTTPEIKKYIFKNLWKIVFKIENKECDENRRINSRTIRVLYESNPKLFKEQIALEPDFFSQISDKSPLLIFIFFIGLYPEIFPILNADTKVLIKSAAKKSKTHKAFCWFLEDDIKKHLEWIKKNESEIKLIAPNQFNPIYKIAFESGLKNEFIELIIHFYAAMKKKNDDFQERKSTLKRFMSEFDKKACTLLLKKIDSNKHLSNKIYGLVNKDLLDNLRKVLDDSKFGKEEDYPSFFKWIKKE